MIPLAPAVTYIALNAFGPCQTKWNCFSRGLICVKSSTFNVKHQPCTMTSSLLQLRITTTSSCAHYHPFLPTLPITPGNTYSNMYWFTSCWGDVFTHTQACTARVEWLLCPLVCLFVRCECKNEKLGRIRNFVTVFLAMYTLQMKNNNFYVPHKHCCTKNWEKQAFLLSVQSLSKTGTIPLRPTYGTIHLRPTNIQHNSPLSYVQRDSSSTSVQNDSSLTSVQHD